MSDININIDSCDKENPNKKPEKSDDEVRKEWLETSQDLYVIRSQKPDAISYIPWVDYREAPMIEWYHSERDNHFCFLTENGYQPENLTGPTLTKVIPWNVESARLPGNYQGPPLQPGYLLDLRVLHMTRLLNPEFEQPMHHPRLPPISKIIRQRNNPQAGRPSGTRTDDGYVPLDRRYEFQNVPFDNLYVVSWVDPLAEHGIDEYSPYQINYLTANDLNAMQPAQEVSTGDTMVVLESYFKAAGAQTGALNPRDWEYISLHGSCYVANLNTFAK